MLLEILNTFDTVADAIRNFDLSSAFKIDEFQNRRPQFVNKLLTEVFQKYNIISKWDDIDVKYIDQGGKGKVFKLENLRDYENEDEYVIKVFHQLKGKYWQPFKSHGCYAEINNAIYWRNHEGLDTHRGKFFFASMKSGYIVSKYLDEDVRLPERVVPEYKYGIKCTDEEKHGPINGYNRIKGYNYDYGGMRVVNRLKNSDKIARTYLEKIKECPKNERTYLWEKSFHERNNNESKLAGLALGIKYLDNKNYYIDRCIGKNITKVNQALAYVLKYLPYEDGRRYFEKLVSTNDEVTQIILFNEIPLLAKRKDANIEIKDDINAALAEIIPERILQYYWISEKYAMPQTIEHLASFVHLLPHDAIPSEYKKLVSIDNYNLHDRLVWKFNMLPEDYKSYAYNLLKENVKDKNLMNNLSSKTF